MRQIRVDQARRRLAGKRGGGVSDRTVQRDWAKAKALLYGALADD